MSLGAQTPDAKELIRQAFERDENIFDTRRDYTYVEHQTMRNFDSKGKVTSTERETHEILYLSGEPYEKLIAKDGKQLSAKDAKREDEKLEREAAKRKREAERGNKSQEKERAERRKTAREVSAAFDFKIAGTESVGGLATWMVDATPRKGYQPKTRDGKIFMKTSGRMWIAQEEGRLAKAEIRVDDTISFGLFLFRLKPGARINFERTLVAPTVWLPKHVFVKGEAKLGMIKTFRTEIEIDYSDYRRFQTDSKIVVEDPGQ